MPRLVRVCMEKKMTLNGMEWKVNRNDMGAQHLHHQAAYVGIGLGVGVAVGVGVGVGVRCSSIKSSRSLSGLTAAHQKHVVPQHKTQNAKYGHSRRAKGTHTAKRTHTDTHAYAHTQTHTHTNTNTKKWSSSLAFALHFALHNRQWISTVEIFN